MKKKINQIAFINIGVYEKAKPNGNTLYLQGKDFDEEGNLRKDAVLTKELILDTRLSKHLLQDRDILLMAKGETNKACIYYAKMGQAVASSTFFVIRLHEVGVLPEFLQWYLNMPSMQKQLSTLARGTHISSLSKKAIQEEVEVLIPSLDTQEKILQTYGLWQQEKHLLLELLDNKETLYANLLMNLTKETAK